MQSTENMNGTRSDINMAKIKFIRTSVKTYEPDMQYYKPGMTIEEIAQLECDNCMNGNSDIELMFESVDSDEMTYEIIPDEGETDDGQ